MEYSPLLLLPGPLWPCVVVHLRVPSMSQIELFNNLIVSKQMADIELLVLQSNMQTNDSY